LLGCDKSTIYHTPEWKSVLENAFGYDPKYLFLVDDTGLVVGELPLFFVNSRLFGSHLSSLPFSHSCGYIGRDSHRNEILETAIRISDCTKSKYLEIRDAVNYSRFREADSFYTHILELSSKVEQVWGKLDKGSVRWAIRKSMTLGTSVITTKNLEDIREFYELNCMTKRDLGVPCHPWKNFRNLFEILGDSAILYAVRYNGEMVAGGIMEYFKDTVLYGYGASNPKFLNLHPYHAFLWATIENACSDGYRYLDFGRSSNREQGLREFKRRWGTFERALCYSYYPPTSSSALADAYGKESMLYRLGSATIRHAPMTIYKRFSDSVVGEIG
jgi:hypothetical protein